MSDAVASSSSWCALTLLGALGAARRVALRRPALRRTPRRCWCSTCPSELDEAPPTYGPFSLGRLTGRAPGRDVLRPCARGGRRPRRGAGPAHRRARLGLGRIAEVRDAVLAFRRRASRSTRASPAAASASTCSPRAAGDRSARRPPRRSSSTGWSLTAMFLRGTFDKLGVTPNFVHVGAVQVGGRALHAHGLSGPRARRSRRCSTTSTRCCSTAWGARARTAPRLRAGDAGRRPVHGARGARLRPARHAALRHRAWTRWRCARATAAARGSRSRATWTGSRAARGRPRGAGGGRGRDRSGRSREDPMDGRVLGSETLIEALRDARTRNSVKAIVLRIDSPGGSAQASDDMWREVVRCRDDQAGDRQHVRRRRLGRLLHRGRRRRHRRRSPPRSPARSASIGGKLNIAGLYRKLGLNVETVFARPPRRDAVAVPGLHARGAQRSTSASSTSSTAASSSAWRRAAVSRCRRSTRWRRGASGAGSPRATSASSTGWAGSTTRSRSRASGRDCVPTKRSWSTSIPRPSTRSSADCSRTGWVRTTRARRRVWPCPRSSRPGWSPRDCPSGAPLAIMPYSIDIR